MKKLDIDKGRLEKVYLIYYQYITLPCYYACNTEWVFNHREATFFDSQESAEYNIKRLTEYESRTLSNLGIRSQDLKIEMRYMVVSNWLNFSY